MIMVTVLFEKPFIPQYGMYFKVLSFIMLAQAVCASIISR